MTRILLVDDNRDDRLLARRELHRGLPDADITEISDGAAFDRARAAEPFDVVITDYRLRWTTGIEILAAAKKQDPYRPVIMFTATATQEDAIEAMKRGLDDYVVKSAAHIRRLTIAVTTALERAARHRAVDDERERYVEEQRRLRAEAEATSRAKDQFLATLSHELRTPLTSVLGWARMIQTGAMKPENVNAAIATIERNAQSMMALIEQLLDVAAIIADRLELQLTEIDIGRVVRAVVESLEPSARAKEIVVETRSDAPGLPLLADGERVRQIVSNLLSNAVKFTPAGGLVLVAWRRANGAAEIAVSDSGPGIPPTLRDQIFDRFWQADASATRHHGGLGLGLAIVKHLVDAHHGTIVVESPGTLGGVSFTVRLPLDGSRSAA